MKYVLNPIYLEGPYNEVLLREAIAKKLGFNVHQFRFEILDREFVWNGQARGVAYTVAVETAQFVRDTSIRFLLESPDIPIPRYAGKDQPVVIGAGLAGLMAAYILALSGAKPIVLERGKDYQERLADISLFDTRNRLEEESNARYGCGGVLGVSGFTFRQDSDVMKRYIIHLFEMLGIKGNQDHDRFVSAREAATICTHLIEEIRKRGGEIHYKTKVVGGKSFLGKMKEIRYRNEVEERSISATHVLVCCGEENLPVLEKLGVSLPQEPTAISLYLEKPMVELNRAVYGSMSKDNYYPSYFHVESGTTKNGLAYETGFFYEKSRPLFFGKMPGECVLGLTMAEPSSQSGIVPITIQINDSAEDLSGLSQIGFKRNLPYLCPGELLKSYMLGQEPLKLGTIKPSYNKGVYLANLNVLFGGRIGDAFHQILDGFIKTQDCFNDGRALLLGPGITKGNGAASFAKTKGKTNVRGLYFAASERNWAYDGLATAQAGIEAALSLIAGN